MEAGWGDEISACKSMGCRPTPLKLAQWLAWKRRRRERHDQIRREMDAGQYLTQEEVEAELEKRGML
jgi:hypothetical protein